MARTIKNFVDVTSELGRGFAGTPIRKSCKGMKGGPYFLLRTEQHGYVMTTALPLTNAEQVVIKGATSAKKAATALHRMLNPKAAKPKASKKGKGKGKAKAAPASDTTQPVEAANDSSPVTKGKGKREAANDNKAPGKIHFQAGGASVLCGFKPRPGMQASTDVNQVTCKRCLARLRKALAA
jgi:hypothetical protein